MNAKISIVSPADETVTKTDFLIKMTPKVSTTFAIIALLFPILTAFGWIYDIPVLRKGHPTLPAMQPNTAFFLSLSACAVLINQLRNLTHVQAAGKAIVVSTFALFTLLFGALTLTEYMFDWNFGIDTFFGDRAPSALQPFPGRASPQTSFNFAVLGAVQLGYLIWPRLTAVRQAGLLLVVANSLIAMTGYLFNTGRSYGFPIYEPSIGMAVHASWSFVLISVALLFSRPTEGVMRLVISDTRTGNMGRKITLAAIFAPPLIALITRAGMEFGLYDMAMHVSLFTVIMVALILVTTWRTAVLSEQEELHARAALLKAQNAEKASRISEERLDLAVRGTNLATWDWNIKTGDVAFNHRWAEMRGFQPPEISPRVEFWLEGIHPEDRPHVDEVLQKHLRGEIPEYASEQRVRTKEGRWIWILDRGKVFERDENGAPVRMSGTEQDINDQKTKEMERLFLADAGDVLASSLDFEETLKNIAQLTVKNLADFCIIDIIGEDHEIRRLKVISRDIGKKWICDTVMSFAVNKDRPYLGFQDLQPGKTFLADQVTPEMMRDLAQSSEQLSILNSMEPRSVLGVPLQVRERLLGFITMVSSSSSRIFNQSDVRLAGELAYRASLSIENARLYRLAQHAVQTREDVLAIVSHDLKNPLSVIGMISGSLRCNLEAGSSELAASVARIKKLVNQSLRLVNDLLDFAKVESGTFTVNKFAERPSEVVSLPLESAVVQANFKGQTILVDVARSLPRIDCDANRIGQVFANLLGNAIKFTPEGGTISVSAVEKGQNMLFSITDTGPGIPPGSLSRIFDRFWQAPDTKSLGTGLGLSIARGIVEKHSGQIWAESELRKGTTVFFTIPLASPETASRFRPLSRESISKDCLEALDQQPLTGIRVLIVDDSEDILQLTKHALETAGADVAAASTVMDALSIFSEFKPDVLLTDIEMPDGGGLALIEKIHQMPQRELRNVPIVALTAYDRIPELERIANAGFERILGKPINFLSVIAAVKEMSGKARVLH